MMLKLYFMLYVLKYVYDVKNSYCAVEILEMVSLFREMFENITRTVYEIEPRLAIYNYVTEGIYPVCYQGQLT